MAPINGFTTVVGMSPKPQAINSQRRSSFQRESSPISSGASSTSSSRTPSYQSSRQGSRRGSFVSQVDTVEEISIKWSRKLKDPVDGHYNDWRGFAQRFFAFDPNLISDEERKIAATFTLGFMSKGARSSVFASWTPFHNPFDYIGSRDSRYYRSQGFEGDQNIKFALEIKKNPFSMLFEDKDFGKFKLVSTRKIIRGIDGILPVVKAVDWRPKNTNSTIPWDKTLSDLKSHLLALQPSQVTFIDFTDFIPYEDELEFLEKAKSLKKLLKDHGYEDKLIFGGTVPLRLPSSSSPIGLRGFWYVSTSPKCNDVEKNITSFISSMMRPDPVEVRRLMFELGINLDTIKRLTSTKNTPYEKNVWNFDELVNKISQQFADVVEKSINSRKFVGFKILQVSLQAVLAEINGGEAEKLKTNPFFLQSLNTISYYLSSNLRNTEYNNWWNSILEEIAFLKAHLPTNDLSENLQRLGSVSDLQPRVFTVNSGMNALRLTFEALHRMKAREDRTPLNVQFSPRTYFETNLVYFATSANRVKKSSAEVYDPNIGPIYVTSLHPNSTSIFGSNDKKSDIVGGANPLTSSFPPPEVLKERDSPTFLLIDTSTTLIADEEFKDLLSKYKEAIETGKLVVINHGSFAKLSQAGADKYIGGYIMVYGGNSEALNPFFDKLSKYCDEEKLNDEAAGFISLFFKNPQTLIEHQNALLKGARYLRTLLVPRPITQSQPMAPFLQTQFSLDDKLPFVLLFHPYLDKLAMEVGVDKNSIAMTVFRENFQKLITNYLMYKAHGFKLPIEERMSFGFQHGCINSMGGDAVRVSTGYMEKEEIETLITIIKDLRSQLIGQLTANRKPDMLVKLRCLTEPHNDPHYDALRGKLITKGETNLSFLEFLDRAIADRDRK